MKSFIVRFNLTGIGTVAHAVSANDDLEAIRKALEKDSYVSKKLPYYLEDIEVTEV